MKRTLLVTRPNYDDATAYLYQYAGEVIRFTKERGINVINLERPSLTRRNLSKRLKAQNPFIVFFNAHGTATQILGDKIKGKEEILIKEKKNEGLLKGRITYARACLAAASLGECYSEKGSCFIGHNAPFSFWMDDRHSTEPLKDKIARLFLEPSNLVVTSLLKGNSTKEAFDKSVNLMKKNIRKLLRNDGNKAVIHPLVMILWNNLESQKIHGDLTLRLE